ncbi:Hypothetical_protein [Hexamita inflata]|uniref:Hypothetical_protein n=1 Tax=Hexamita inflata TaxID=28002 RepID=A0AA86NFL8_9EUKA|nr:Hypothetical protein HINF_LOCUS6041 [Hexamita inflata]CAI9959161.1 Hypothetical protein HINF_LOCUS46806 [Hexamita inflata]
MDSESDFKFESENLVVSSGLRKRPMTISRFCCVQSPRSNLAASSLEIFRNLPTTAQSRAHFRVGAIEKILANISCLRYTGVHLRENNKLERLGQVLQHRNERRKTNIGNNIKNNDVYVHSLLLALLGWVLLVGRLGCLWIGWLHGF